MNEQQLNELAKLITEAYAQGIINAVDLAEYLAINGICFKKDMKKKFKRYMTIWED